MELNGGSKLQGGRYVIERTLGQGGFGITYLGVQTVLDAKVAVKEFFMKDLHNRDEGMSHVTVGSVGSRELVERFRQKFIKEARNIYRLKHANIIPVIDVFEENGTAYYVMEYVGGGSLADRVKLGVLSEADSVRYIRQVASALGYIHGKQIMHLDVKPANILVNADDNAVLIDFGLAKQYDSDGMQTSTTPVGISHGYAPMEQYKRGGVSTFSPATDIYSLGATLYKLVTGVTPPDASDVNDDGLPEIPSAVSASVRRAIVAAMQPRRKDRPQSIEEFLALLDGCCAPETAVKAVVPPPFDCTVILGNSTGDTTGSFSAIPGVRTFNVNGVEFRMVTVEGGKFLMGSVDGEDDEMPLHTVTLDNYSIGETPVTQELWETVMGNNPSRSKAYMESPVDQVSWNDCQEFIKRLNGLTGVEFRLPTEAEWEFAARGGKLSKRYKYSGSPYPEDVAWFWENCDYYAVHPVKCKYPNELGLYDMSGNVWEWCNDLYDMDYYKKSPLHNPQGAEKGKQRVFRGGCWRSSMNDCSVATRAFANQNMGMPSLSLRLAL